MSSLDKEVQTLINNADYITEQELILNDQDMICYSEVDLNCTVHLNKCVSNQYYDFGRSR